MLGTVLAALICASTTPSDLEKQGLAHVRREFERIGRALPASDPALTQAARALAKEAVNTSADEASDLLAISQVVSDAQGFDPTPRAVVVRAIPPAGADAGASYSADYALTAFLKRDDYNQEPATHVGVGAVVVGDRAVIVALLAERKATLLPFPRRFEKAGAQSQLCGDLRAPLRDPELYVTRPDGDVDRIALVSQSRGRFCAQLAFPQVGRHTVEVIGRADKGPEVAAIFFVDAGVPGGAARPNRIPEAHSEDEARATLLLRINGLRTAHGAREVELDPRLSAIAQAHSERMAKEHFFAHVSPEGDDLKRRLEKAGYLYTRAGENLGLAAGPVAAHFAIEHSPGHRRNLLDGDYSALGIGIAFEEISGRRQAIVTEVLARPLIPARDPLAVAYRAIDERRAAHHLPPLVRSPVLEAIAIEHARRALALDQPKVSLPGTAVHDRVFKAMEEVRTAAVDFYVSDDPAALPDSKSLEDPRNDRIGVGAVRGNSPTYGNEKFWVVVIYADAH